MLNARLVRLLVGLIVVTGITVVVVSASTPGTVHLASAARLHRTRAARHPPASAAQPNIVFVLTDDLSWNLLQYMPAVQAMERDGVSFRNYFVSDSLCCPSRSSILTGNFPHDTHVFSNVGTNYGGFHVFYSRGEEQRTFAVALQRAGYRTALMGKYLNGYMGGPGSATNLPATYVPPGWSDWDVAGNGYPEFDYQLNQNGTLHYYGHDPSDYLTDVVANLGVNFIDRSASVGKPFFLELATFAPHAPEVPAPRDAEDFPGLKAPRAPSFDTLPTNPPGWLAGRPPLRPGQIDKINAIFRRRAQSVQAVDDMIDQVEAAVSALGLTNNTYFVFSSDNGLHMGDYRLMPGKMTAFDTDIRVPLVVAGPGVPRGVTDDKMVENVDLAPTFAELGRSALPADGHSLVPLLRGEKPDDWRNAILVEHHGPDLQGIDPDFQQPASGDPTTYEAMRTPTFLYVEYRDGEREYYDLRNDPFELHNLAGALSSKRLATLNSELLALESCHNGQACWAAMHVPSSP